MVRVRKLVLAIAAATALTSEMALALGLGGVTLKSTLNQPLVAEIELLDTDDLTAAQIVPSLASAADFSRAGVTREEFLRDLQFSSQVRPDGRSVIRISSTRPIREPYLNFLVEVLWPSGRLLREYSLLLDPPVYSPETAAAVAPHLPVTAPATQRPAAPAPDAATATAEPAQDELYRTAPRDTLWEIAQRTRKGGSVHQAMLAIQDVNPNAFIDQNINLVRSGVVLRLPSAEQIASRPQAQAIREVAEQNARWRQGRTGAAGPRQLDATQRGEQGAVTPRRSGADNLRLVAPEAGGATSGSDSGVAENAQALRDRLAVTQESLDSTRLENAELKDRLNDLQGQIDKLQRLMQLKDDQLAALQAQLGEGQPSAAQAQLAADAPQTAEADGEAPQATADGAVPAEPAAEPQASETPATETPAATTPDGEQDPVADLLKNPAAWGGAALLLILLGLLVRSRRNAAREDESRTAARASTVAREPQPAEAVAGLAAAPVIGAYRSDSASTAPVDPLTEATVCIAYGRHQAAAELLRNAIGEQPERTDLRLKLMEVYGELGDAEGFAAEEARLKELGGSAAEVEQLKVVYPAMAAGAVGAVAASRHLDDLSLDDLQIEESAAHRPVADPDDAFDLSLDDLTLEDARADASGEEPHPAPAGWQSEQDGRQDDIDRAFEELSFEEPLDVSVDELQPAQEFSFDLDDEPAQPAAPDDEAVAEPAVAPAAQEPFDFDASEQAQPELADAEFTMPEEFDLSLDAEPAPAQAPEADSFAAQLSAAEAAREEPEQPAEPMDVPPAAPVEPVPAQQVSAAEEGFDEADDDFDFFTETDETTTKLDLARAYIDMGDDDGARDILDEVLKEGSSEQRQEARDMLAKLA